MGKLNRILDVFQNVVEYLLALVFIISAVELWWAPALTDQGFISLVLGGQMALYVYMAWFFFIGFGLIYAKVRKKKKLHTNMLMIIYLTTIYTGILTVTIFGLDWSQVIDDAITGLLAAVFWLRWKFRTEYFNPREFQKKAAKYRDDLP